MALREDDREEGGRSDQQVVATWFHMGGGSRMWGIVQRQGFGAGEERGHGWHQVSGYGREDPVGDRGS